MSYSIYHIYLLYEFYHYRWAKCPAGAKAGYEKKAGALKVKQQAEMAKYKAAKAKAAGPKRAL